MGVDAQWRPEVEGRRWLKVWWRAHLLFDWSGGAAPLYTYFHTHFLLNHKPSKQTQQISKSWSYSFTRKNQIHVIEFHPLMRGLFLEIQILLTIHISTTSASLLLSLIYCQIKLQPVYNNGLFSTVLCLFSPVWHWLLLTESANGPVMV